MSKARLLIVHPEPSTLALLTSMLRSLDHVVIDEAANDRVAVRLMERGGVGLVLAGIDPSDPEGLELLAYTRRKHKNVPVILLFSGPNAERMKEAQRLGALAVLKYPVPAIELRAAVTQALGVSAAAQAGTAPAHHGNGTPAPAASANGTPPAAPHPNLTPAPAPRADLLARELGVIGNDASLRQAIELAGSIAPTRSPVLIVGEHGTGKALLARTIHSLGARGDQPFVPVDGTALADLQAERERFEFKPDALGDAPPAEWTNKLAHAQGGTLFVSEVAALSANLQWHLLHALQVREIEAANPLHNGGSADIRFLFSTSENLSALVEQGKFRQDLYHRISVICLKVPPLRHRGNDIEQLAEFFRSRFAQEFGKNVVGFTRDALDALIKHDWPGNVRELEGVIQRGVVLCQGTRITSGHLSPSLGHSRAARTSPKAPRPHLPMSIRPLKEALEEPEKRIIIQALQALNWNRQETARVLDINRTTLYKKMKKYGLLVDGPIWVN
jgi:two-component system response regulator HydG